MRQILCGQIKHVVDRFQCGGKKQKTICSCEIYGFSLVNYPI